MNSYEEKSKEESTTTTKKLKSWNRKAASLQRNQAK